MASRHAVRRAFQVAEAVCNRASRIVYTTPLEREVGRWHAQDGDHTLRLDYDLSAESVVVDLGGYRGQWASDIFAKYACTVHVFEPVPVYAEGIRRRFARNPRIVVHQCGLGSRESIAEFGMHGDGTSQYRASTPDKVQVTLHRAEDYLSSLRLGHIDLMKINIEGGEYDLLEHLVASGWICRIRDIQVQFHDCVPGAEARMRAIQRDLADTHEVTYQYPFVWENWRRTCDDQTAQQVDRKRALA